MAIFLLFNIGFSASLNESFNFLENESYYEFSKDLTVNSIINIPQNNITIDGLNHYFTGGFNIDSKNVILINIKFKSFSDSLVLNNSYVKIINCSFEDVNNALKLTNSNLSLVLNHFLNVNNLMTIVANDFSINISDNTLNNVKNHFIINSSYKVIDRVLNLNNNYSDFYALFKIFSTNSNNYFNAKQYLFYNNLIYNVANNFQELSELLIISDNVAIGSNITANKVLTINKDVNIFGQNNYFISNIKRDYAIVTIGDISVKIDSLNLITDSSTLLSNMGSRLVINNSNFYPKIKGYYQLQGSSELNNSNFYFFNSSEKNIGAYVESGNASFSKVNFFGASTGLLALSDSVINGISPECVNHSTYKLMQNNLYSLFLSTSVIIPEKSFIYGKDYDYYKGVVVQDLGKNALCAYPGFLKNGNYPWEEEYNAVLNNVKAAMKLFSRNPDSALGKLNFLNSYENYSISWKSSNLALISNEGFIFNPFLNSKVASIEVKILKDDLSITYPVSILVLPITPINASRVISNGVFQNNNLFLTNDYELDSNYSVTKWPSVEKIRVADISGSTLVLKKNGEGIETSVIDGYYEIAINPFNAEGIVRNLTEAYDFYWMKNEEVFLIERLSVKTVNNVLITINSAELSYFDTIRKIIVEESNDYKKNVVDFSKLLKNNVLILSNGLFIQRNLGNIVSVIIPSEVYSKVYWDGLFLLPTLIPNSKLDFGTALFSFKLGSEAVDLYSDQEFIIKVSGFSGFRPAFENSTGVYKMSAPDYYDDNGDLVIKTKHLSNFYIYESIKEQQLMNESSDLFNESQTIAENNNELSPTTGFISLLNINQKQSLSIIRVLLSILIVLPVVFIAKKNHFFIKK